jgi:hypothetical protein
VSKFTLFLLTATALAGIATILYWYRQRRRPPTYTVLLVVCGLALVGGSVLLDRPEYDYAPRTTPVAIAIVFDLSPSMLAIPDPSTHSDTEPRYVRARETLLAVFRALEERQQNIIVSLIGFSKDAEILMGWDYSTVQLREILAFGLSPDLFASSGTSIEAAVETVVDVFDMLPQDLKETSRKIAIVVSDGEDTTPSEYFGYALEELSSNRFDVIALQSGLLGTSEGVPRYGQVGEFLGFEMMSGNLYSTPNIDAMHAISQASPQRGLYVRAEERDAIEQVLQFTVGGQLRNPKFPGILFASLSLFGIVALVGARVLQ